MSNNRVEWNGNLDALHDLMCRVVCVTPLTLFPCSSVRCINGYETGSKSKKFRIDGIGR
jgi:hypothetical protein